MAEAVLGGVWIWRVVYLLAFLVMLFLRLLPLPTDPGALPGPDLLLCLSCAWVLRRPDHLPALLIAGAVLVEDLLLMKPPGLWAAIVLIGTEFLRSRAAFSRELTWVSEWIMVSIVMSAMLVAYRLLMSLMVLPQPGLGMSVAQLIFSVIAYPFVVGVLRVTLGLRKPITGEVDARGRRL